MRSLVLASTTLVAACSLQMSLPPELAGGHATQMDVSSKVFGEEIRIGPYVTSQFRTSESAEQGELLLAKKREDEKTFTFQLTRDGAALRDVTCRASRSKSSTLGLQSTDEEMRCLVRKVGAADAVGRLEMTDSVHGVLHAGAEDLGIDTTTSGVVGVILRRQGHAVAAWQYSTPRTAWVGSEADPEMQATACAAMASAFVYDVFLSTHES
jgi:hypothetical protein